MNSYEKKNGRKKNGRPTNGGYNYTAHLLANKLQNI